MNWRPRRRPRIQETDVNPHAAYSRKVHLVLGVVALVFGAAALLPWIVGSPFGGFGMTWTFFFGMFGIQSGEVAQALRLRGSRGATWGARIGRGLALLALAPVVLFAVPRELVRSVGVWPAVIATATTAVLMSAIIFDNVSRRRATKKQEAATQAQRSTLEAR